MKSFIKRNRIVLICVLLYIFIFLCSMAAEIHFVFHSYKDIMLAVAEDDRQYYIENGKFSPSALRNGAYNFVYGSAGERLDCASGFSDGDYFDFDRCAAEIVGKTGGQDFLYLLRFLPHFPFTGIIMVAFPMDDGGLFLFAKEQSSVWTGLSTLTAPTLVISLIAVCSLGAVIRKKQAVEQLQKEYIDNINHELKSPIAAAKALAEPIHDGLVQDADSLRRYTGIMLNELSGLERTVSDMLELSRIQSHQTDTHKASLTPQAVFGETLGKYAVLCDEFGLRFSHKLPEDAELYTNGVLASRLLEILLDNAFKFTLAQGCISVEMLRQSRRWVVSVRDDGIPIPPADQKHIFERFYQGAKGRERKGSGLGLAIAGEIAKCMNEEIWLEQSNAEETEFRFTLHDRRI